VFEGEENHERRGTVKGRIISGQREEVMLVRKVVKKKTIQMPGVRHSGKEGSRKGGITKRYVPLTSWGLRFRDHWLTTSWVKKLAGQNLGQGGREGPKASKGGSK